MQRIKIGFPRSLHYYAIFPLWKTFFQELGMEVVVSEETNKKVLDEGIKEAVTDACIPLKIFYGHVVNLASKVDFLFIPRIINWENTSNFCPKFLGLPDMIRHGIKGIPPIISPRISTKSLRASWRSIENIARTLNVSKFKAIHAYRRGLTAISKYKELLRDGWTPLEAEQILASGNSTQKLEGKMNIALLGYPYALYDSYINSNLISQLRGLDVKIHTADTLPAQKLKRNIYDRKDAFWHYSDSVLRAGMHFIQDSNIEGLIHVTAFGCGPDFLVNKILEIEAKEHSKPLLTLSLDDKNGDSGIITRLESFINMIPFAKGTHHIAH